MQRRVLPSLEFVMIILHDTIFIIELFLRYYHGHRSDFLVDTPAIFSGIYSDLKLLENQLPYFVLKEVYELAFTSSDDPTFMDLSYKFFCYDTRNSIPEQAVVKHFTDLIRTALLKSFPEVEYSHGEILLNFPCAMKLQESGVKFKYVERECLLDIRFEKRKHRIISSFEVRESQIPHFEVNHQTECLLRNIMALEQCHNPVDTRVCNYVYFVDRLINTEKDVDLLVGEGIISNYLEDNVSVANMFNKLCLQIHLSRSCYYYICKELKAHCDNPWNKTKGTLKSVFFSNLYRVAVTIAAIVILVVTFLTQ